MIKKDKIRAVLRLLFKPIIELIINKRIRGNFIYYSFFKHLKVKRNTFLFESYHASNTTGNVYAIFQQLLKENPKGKYYWVNQKGNNNDMLRFFTQKNVEVVNYESITYYRLLASCQYLVNDTSFMPYFVKQKGQIYINTWHGTPLKTLGRDIKNSGKHTHKNIQRNILHTDILLMPNHFTADKLMEAYDLRGIFNGEVYLTGNARVDLNFLNQNEMRKKYKLPENKKIILYAPTWKKNISSTTEEDILLLLDEVNQIQSSVSSEFVVLLKAHYFIYERFAALGYQDKVLPNWIDTNELLSCVERLITDYSSIFFDFLPLGRPIYFYIPDKDFYAKTRGFYLDIEQLPGSVSMNIDDVINQLSIDSREYQNTYYNRMNDYLDRFCQLDDGNASLRAADIILNNNSLMTERINYRSSKEIILLYSGGLYNNGITSSVINLSKKIDYSKYELVIIESTNMHPDKKENMEKIDSRAHTLFLFSNSVRTFISSYNQNLFYEKGYSSKWLFRKILVQDIQLELQRISGDLTPDYGIDFGGYNKVFNALFALNNFKKKSVYLHSLMMEEYEKKVHGKYTHKQDLTVIFSLYHLFNNVVSVSESSNEKNREDLQIFGIESEKMIYINNLLDAEKIFENKERYKAINKGQLIHSKVDGRDRLPYDEEINQFGVQTLTGIIAPESKTINFVTVGRLSPEKNYLNLLKAFYKVYQENQTIRLYMVGSGPLLSEIQSEIIALGLERAVIMYGYLANPIPVISMCDCLISSSNYEGQGLVLLEAMTIKRHVIATDVVGNQSVLQEYPESLVENSIEGLENGIRKFINGEIPLNDFDYNTYNEESIRKFYKVTTSR